MPDVLRIEVKSLETEYVRISGIEKAMRYQRVRVVGRVTDSYDTKSMRVLTLEDSSGSIRVIASKNDWVGDGDYLEVRGMVDTYRGKLEIKAADISRI